MMDSKSGWLVGRGPSALWETHDEGITWHELHIPHLDPGVYADIRFVSLKEGWMFAISQSLYATADGGGHWIAQDLPKFDGVIAAAWVLPKLGLTWLGGGAYQPSDTPDGPNFAVKRYDSDKWGILAPIVYFREADGVWKLRQLPPGSWSVFDVKFWTEKLGFAVGDACFYSTETGGDHWEIGVLHEGRDSVDGSPEEMGSPTVSFLDRSTGWMSLNDHSLYRTENGGRD